MKTVNDMKMGVVGKVPSKRKIVFVCVVVSVLLFLCGVLSPVWTDNFGVYLFCLLPFYAYTYTIESVFVEGPALFRTERGLYASKMWVAGIAITAVLSIVGAFFLGDSESVYYGPCLILAFNIPVSIVYVVIGAFSDSVRYARPLRHFVA